MVNGGALGTPSSGTVTNLTGTASININGTVGATTPTTGAFTTLTTSSTVTLNGGTANGVAYLNGSKVLTTGSALTFDGSQLSVGVASPSAPLHIASASAGGKAIRLNGRSADGASDIQFFDNTGVTQYGDVGVSSSSMFIQTNTNIPIIFYQNGNEGMRLTSTGLGIGTSSPTNTLSVNGNANITGNTTLGDASTDTVTVNGYMGVGGAASNAARAINIESTSLTGGTQRGLHSNITGSSAATSAVIGVSSFPKTAAASFTVADVMALQAGTVDKGAGSTITNQHGLYVSDQTQGTNNYGITSLVSSGTNKWNIYASGTAANYFAGDVLVGTTTGRVGNSITPKMQLEGTSAATSTIMVTRDSADANPANLYLAKSRAGTLGGNTIVSSGDQLGAVYFFGADGTQMVPAAYINAVVDGTPGVNDMPGRLSFWTTPDGSPNPAERFRLGASEAVFNDPGNDYDLRVESDTNTHALFVDAGNSRVGVNQSAPDTAFSVNGIIQSTGEASVVSIANGATATVITPNRGFSYINISRSDTASFGLLLLVFRTTTTLEIVSTVSDKTSATYSASVSGTALQITNSSGSTVSFYASGICIAFGAGD